MNEREDLSRLSGDLWKKMVERYRNDMMRMAEKKTPEPAAVTVQPPQDTEVSVQAEEANPAVQTVRETPDVVPAQAPPALTEDAVYAQAPMPSEEDAVPENTPSESAATPSEEGEENEKIREERELLQLYERTRAAREEISELERRKAQLDREIGERERKLTTETEQREETPLPTESEPPTSADPTQETPPKDAAQTESRQPVQPLERTRTGEKTAPRNPYDFSDYTGTARLIVQVFMARQALPLEDATVTVSEQVNADGAEKVLSVQQTDENGKTQPIELPAPPEYKSEKPGFSDPFARYNVLVRKKGYYTQKVIGVTLFAGITSIVPVNIEPLPRGEQSGEEMFVVGDYDL
ncbi:MAG: hypothetical protein EGP89_02280 [Ruminococcaceae bacterium]|nr:hypothetical protein [Oscillospiraceae bacterium]